MTRVTGTLRWGAIILGALALAGCASNKDTVQQGTTVQRGADAPGTGIPTGSVRVAPRPPRALPGGRSGTVRTMFSDDFLRATPLSYASLEGWRSDDHGAALTALAPVCEAFGKKPDSADLPGPTFGGTSLGGTVTDWRLLCTAAGRTHPRAARGFFEQWFAPVHIASAPDDSALFTGYFEPELSGSRRRTRTFQYPLYAKPDDLVSGKRYLSREKIDRGALAGRGLEIAWVDDPVDLFFLHIQGSGRVRMADGSVMRVGFAGKNGHAYKAIGRTLADWGEMSIDQTSAPRIKEWVRANPQRMYELFATNPSYVFFTERPSLSPGLGPVGSFGTPLPSARAIAVDRTAYALGLPVWVETDSPVGRLNRLMIALDTGGAIKGAQRADIFWGSGDEAGRIAGTTRYYGRMTALVPRAALARISGAGV